MGEGEQGFLGHRCGCPDPRVRRRPGFRSAWTSIRGHAPHSRFLVCTNPAGTGRGQWGPSGKITCSIAGGWGPAEVRVSPDQGARSAAAPMWNPLAWAHGIWRHVDGGSQRWQKAVGSRGLPMVTGTAFTGCAEFPGRRLCGPAWVGATDGGGRGWQGPLH